MAATQRVEVVFSVAKHMGIMKKLSLGALYDVIKSVDFVQVLCRVALPFSMR